MLTPWSLALTISSSVTDVAQLAELADELRRHAVIARVGELVGREALEAGAASWRTNSGVTP